MGEWLYPLASMTSCDMIVLENRGFGLSKQRSSNKVGMKIAAIASDYSDLVRHHVNPSKGPQKVFLLGHSMGANIIWAYLQLYHTNDIGLNGILPLDGGLLAVPQTRAAVRDFKVGGAFTWDVLQGITDMFLQG